MFKFKTQTLKFSPQEGDEIVVKGKVQLMQKLQSQGLFAEENKRALPFIPQRIGVITSPTGAAIHDVLNVLERRCPMVPVIIYPTQVQGADAAKQIIQAIELAESRNECDVLLLTRGGGSLEDLWCFNDEKLAYKIAETALPLVAAVGHEVDFTLAEMVADLRAATPSAAAELLAPEQSELQQRLDGSSLELNELLIDQISQLQTRLNYACLQLADPSHAIEHHSQTLNYLRQRLVLQMNQQQSHQQQRLEKLSSQLAFLNPKEKLNFHQQKLTQLKKQLYQSWLSVFNHYKNQFYIQTHTLETLSPLSTLSRGYSIVRDKKTQAVLSSTKKITVNQKVNLLMKDGKLSATIDKVEINQSTKSLEE